MWIQRHISQYLQKNKDLIQIIKGPRQCGKSSLILKIDPSFKELSLDDPSLRELAQNDPELFLKQFEDEKLFIDEAQYAPELFPSLKRRVDLHKREKKSSQTIIRLTGSNQILMDKHIKESLSGRASYFEMNTLSVAEILASIPTKIQTILYQGGWPELYADTNKDTKKYLDDYITSYVEKDIVLSAGIQKSREFLKLTKLLAGRVGEILDMASLANDAGVDAKTVKDWISILEKMGIISLVMPYTTSLSTRLIKSPKVYFHDTGLACRLQGWTSGEPILTSPQQGHLFENLVFCEIYKMNINLGLSWDIFHWRSRDGEEIDFLIKLAPNKFIFIEAKVTGQLSYSVEKYQQVKKVFKNKLPPVYLCHQEGERVLTNNVPIALLHQHLLKIT